jgi:hypothetical protein
LSSASSAPWQRHHKRQNVAWHVPDLTCQRNLSTSLSPTYLTLCYVTASVWRDRSAPTGLLELKADQLEALLLEALDDVADQAALHSIGLDHDESTLPSCHGDGHAALLLAWRRAERRCAAMSMRWFSHRCRNYPSKDQIATAAALRRGAGCGSTRSSASLIMPATSMAQTPRSNEPATTDSQDFLDYCTRSVDLLDNYGRLSSKQSGKNSVMQNKQI